MLQSKPLFVRKNIWLLTMNMGVESLVRFVVAGEMDHVAVVKEWICEWLWCGFVVTSIIRYGVEDAHSTMCETGLRL